jgi:CRP-like cAMP-binding protein
MVGLSSHEVIELIKKNDLFIDDEVFKSLDKDELDIALQKIHVSQISTNETLFNQGDKGDFIVLLLRGSVGVYVKNANHHEVNIATLEENSFFGEIAPCAWQRSGRFQIV